MSPHIKSQKYKDLIKHFRSNDFYGLRHYEYFIKIMLDLFKDNECYKANDLEEAIEALYKTNGVLDTRAGTKIFEEIKDVKQFNQGTNDIYSKLSNMIDFIHTNTKRVGRKYKNRDYTKLLNLPFDFELYLPKAINFFSESTVKKSFISLNLLPDVKVLRSARKFALQISFISSSMKIHKYTLEKNYGACDPIQYILFANSKRITNSILLKNNETVHRDILLHDFEIFFLDAEHMIRPSYDSCENLVDIADDYMAFTGENIDKPIDLLINKKSIQEVNTIMKDVFPSNVLKNYAIQKLVKPYEYVIWKKSICKSLAINCFVSKCFFNDTVFENLR